MSQSCRGRGLSVDTLSQDDDKESHKLLGGQIALLNTQYLPLETHGSATWQESLNLDAMVWSPGMINRRWPASLYKINIPPCDVC